MQLSFQPCGLSNLDVLVAISRETFVTAFEKDNDPDDFQHYMETAFSHKKLQAELEDKNTHFHLAYDGEDLVGYFKLNTGIAQTDVHDEKALEIERIYVLGAHQGKKIGAQMLQKIMELGRHMGKEYIWLGVWEHNPKAIRFYQSHGFQKFGEHPYYIGKDKQTDWLLRLNI